MTAVDGSWPDHRGDGGRIGPYRLVQQVGQGGMGIVHLGLDRRGRAVAVKVLRASVAADHEARGRLGREVETLSRIRDHRVASVIDADIMGPQPYIVTRYVPGPALDEVVDEHGPLPMEHLVRLARGMAEAIRSIHACGVVHRDIKPGNVLLDDGEPVLIDFGIAHLEDDVRHTVGGLVMGTPGYLSPELVEGAAITDATDWWGWAATIAYAASGRPPFGRGRMDVVLARVRAGEVDLEGVDPRLQPLLRASLSPEPRERPHADAVVRALERFAAGHAATVPTPTGDVWDDPSRHAGGPDPTQLVGERGTAVLPSVPVLPSAPVPRSLPAPPSRAGSSSPAAQPASRWAPPTSPPIRRGPGPAAYDDGLRPRRLAPWQPEEVAGQDDPPERHAARRGDPRIGLPARTGSLLALAAGWLGLAAAWPGVAVVVLVGWAVLARTVDHVATGFIVRRHVHGTRGRNVAAAMALAPWHLLMAAVTTALSMAVVAGAALGGVALSAVALAALRGGAPPAGTPVTLAGGGVAALLALWAGVGHASVRRGSRSIVRGLLPPVTAARVVCGLLAAAGAVLLVVAVRAGASLSWAPFPAGPFGW